MVQRRPAKFWGAGRNWKVTEKTNGGKEATLFESGATASVYSARVQDPGKTLGMFVMHNMKADREALEKAVEAAKQAGQSSQIDLSGARSQNAKAALKKAVRLVEADNPRLLPSRLSGEGVMRRYASASPHDGDLIRLACLLLTDGNIRIRGRYKYRPTEAGILTEP